MSAFSDLFQALDATTKTSAKLAALCQYFQTATPEDRLWCIAVLSGRRPKRVLSSTLLRRWAAEAAGIPDWLFEECYANVGDLAETIALLLPPAAQTRPLYLAPTIADLRAMAPLEDAARKAHVLAQWAQLDTTGRLVFNKLLTGGFRMGVSQKLMTRALAQATGQPQPDLAHRLMGNWHPDTSDWHSLIMAQNPTADSSRPYPFCLAHGLDGPPQDLGDARDWRAEWKWDGIRAQLLLRDGQVFLWSRGEELITDRFPEFAGLSIAGGNTVLDGELVVWGSDGLPQPFKALQKRIGRKTVPKTLLASAPARLLAYDCLEFGGHDLRALPLAQRCEHLQHALDQLPNPGPVLPPPAVAGAHTWDNWARTRQSARAQRAEGLMLKRLSAPYHAGRIRGDWWKWKLDPLSIDAVMIYAQAGHGRRATLYTDFTFAVWDGPTLVPFAKAYSGLTDAEFRQITGWVRKNTQQRFGPVRQVVPELVFEIAFEGIQPSPRHKSGVALRFPRMARWRQDKTAAQADTLAHLNALLAQYG